MEKFIRNWNLYFKNNFEHEEERLIEIVKSLLRIIPSYAILEEGKEEKLKRYNRIL